MKVLSTLPNLFYLSYQASAAAAAAAAWPDKAKKTVGGWASDKETETETETEKLAGKLHEEGKKARY